MSKIPVFVQSSVSGEQIPLIPPNATLKDVHDLMSRTYGVPPTTYRLRYSLSFGHVLLVPDVPLTAHGVTARTAMLFHPARSVAAQ